MGQGTVPCPVVHGSLTALEFYHESLTQDDISRQINKITISGNIYLFACHGAFVADSLSQASGENVVSSVHGVPFQNGRARNSWKGVVFMAFLQCDVNGWFISHPNGKTEQYSIHFYL